MRSTACITFFLILYISSAFGAVSRGFYNDPRHPGKCTINENLILSPGETAKHPNMACARIMCGGNGLAQIHTCGAQAYEGCKLGDYINKSLPYSECCKRHIICN